MIDPGENWTHNRRLRKQDHYQLILQVWASATAEIFGYMGTWIHGRHYAHVSPSDVDEIIYYSMINAISFYNIFTYLPCYKFSVYLSYDK